MVNSEQNLHDDKNCQIAIYLLKRYWKSQVNEMDDPSLGSK